MNTRKIQVAIVGGGIGGLTTALALRQAGIEVSLFEQVPQFHNVGAGVQISPNGVRLLQRLGLEKPLRAVAVRPAAIELRRWKDNQVLLRYPLGDECEQTFGASYYTIHRWDLLNVLLAAIPDNIIHLGWHCLTAKPYADGVDLTFSNGSSITAGAVIGADGIHSILRYALFANQVHFSGLGAYRGLIPAERLPFLTEEARVLHWWGPEKHFVCYPVSCGQLINFVAIVPAGHWHIESWSETGRIEDVFTAFSNWNEQVTKIISAASEVSQWMLYDHDPLDYWGNQRLTLLGDAAHPMLPFAAQGATQSIEDAWVLAGCLRNTTNTTITADLRRYEALRKSRVEIVQLQSRHNSEIYHLPDGEVQQQRDAQIATWNEQCLVWPYSYDAEEALTC